MIIVYAYICGDILHKGHLIQLRNAKAMGDKLIVGVLTDKAIMEKKGKPIMPLDERMDLIRELRCVDMVVAQESYSPLDNVIALEPDILMESESHDKRPADGYMRQLDGRVIVTPYYPEQSSSKIRKEVKGR